MTHQKVRVRFAPSPTGSMHIGGLRAALFNWLFARHNQGTFIVRIEDTDQERSKKEYVKALLDALLWVGIKSDEEIVFQSERQELYHAVVAKLIAEKKAYRCFCSSQEIEQRVRAAGITDEHYRYDSFCKDIPFDPQESRPYAIRFSIPEEVEAIQVFDLIRGSVVFEREQLDDFVIFRTDGTPMYNFVVVVDDHYADITHIIRGEEHLPNTPKQILLYHACGYEVPQFAHVPVILAPDGSKLSKRDGAVDVLSYRQEGYLPDALINYIVRLGWACGDQEIFTRQELISSFTLEGVGKKGAIFDRQKLEWLNGVYIRDAQPETLLVTICQDIDPAFMTLCAPYDQTSIIKAIHLYQSRVKTLVELKDVIVQLFKKPAEYNAADREKWLSPETATLLQKLIPILVEQDTFEAHLLNDLLKKFCEYEGIKLVALAQPLRIALTGGASSPGVFELLALLQKQESLARIQAFERFLTS